MLENSLLLHVLLSKMNNQSIKRIVEAHTKDTESIQFTFFFFLYAVILPHFHDPPKIKLTMMNARSYNVTIVLLMIHSRNAAGWFFCMVVGIGEVGNNE